MLSTAEIGRRVSKADHKRELPELRTRLLRAWPFAGLHPPPPSANVRAIG